MGEADRKKQREKVKDRVIQQCCLVWGDCAVRVTILLCQVSEGLEDSERFRVRLKGHPACCTSVGLVKTAKKFSR